MAYEFRYKLRVQFAETDLAGIAHFSNFFRYMEETEHEFLRSLGLSVHAEIDGRLVSWPRVKAECSFSAPLRFEDEFEVHLAVAAKQRASVDYEFRFSKQDGPTIARGSVRVVCASLVSATGKISAIPIPNSIDEKIEVAPRELIESFDRGRRSGE